MEIDEGQRLEQDWGELSPNARTLSYFLSHLEPGDTIHSEPEVLELTLGLETDELERALTELRERQLLLQITLRNELKKVISGKMPTITPGKYVWTPEQAKEILANAPEESRLDTPHYHLLPQYQKFVLKKYGIRIPQDKVK
jgi:hypothetical protein